MRAPALVRGLDYYRHTAFEFVTDRLGAQGTVLGGGRYDGLIETLGGPHTPAVGWAAGIERLARLVGDAGKLPVESAPVVTSEEVGQELNVQRVTFALRKAGLAVGMHVDGSPRKRFEKAKKQSNGIVIMVLANRADPGAFSVLPKMVAGNLSEHQGFERKMISALKARYRVEENYNPIIVHTN
jgi:histidyl-tRNA synthetase